MELRILSQDFCQSSILVRRINIIVRQQFAQNPAITRADSASAAALVRPQPFGVESRRLASSRASLPPFRVFAFFHLPFENGKPDEF
jgi:hypothetical protein